jgi:predicted DNA-binding transcriptional regulator AlpA
MDLMTLKEVAAHFDCHFGTIINWTKEAREGNSTFPLPISQPGKKRRWRKADIEGWNASGQVRPETPAERAIRSVVTADRLARHGVVMK